MNKTQMFLRKHSPTILTMVGASGVVATSVLAVKATPKALALLEEAKNKKGEELTIAETVKIAWKPYIPAVITGASTIACIVGANCLNIKHQASLMSAYALIDNSYKEYRKKVNELYGEESDDNVKKSVIESHLDGTRPLEGDEKMFFDYNSMRFFESTMENVLTAENIFLSNFIKNGCACLNDYYDALGIERVDFGDQIGWSLFEANDLYGLEDLEFSYEKVTMSNGLECWNIVTNIEPGMNYII